MKKILLIIIFLFPINVMALDYPVLHYESAIVYDLTDNKILYELNAKEKRSIASLTKIMTVLTAIENNNDLDKEIIYTTQMSKNVLSGSSVAGFNIGDKLTFSDLLYGTMLPSGADAATALAITTSGSIDEFVKKMNETAQKIGMENSNFVNVHGLDEDNHYSTAKDIQLLLEYALKNQIFKSIYTSKKYTLSTGRNIYSTVATRSNIYQIDTSKIIGSKTGFTLEAGLCISVLMAHENHEIIFITLGAPNNNGTPYNLSDSLELISFIENNYGYTEIIEGNEVYKTIKVENSKIENYEIKHPNTIKVFTEKDYDQNLIKVKYTGEILLSYKNKKGDIIGNIKYYFAGKEIASEDIILDTKIEKDYNKILNSYKEELIFGGVTIFLFISGIFKKKRKF